MSRPRNNTTEEDDETAILASLGLDASSALQSASEYESTVIRQAELSAVPQLSRDGGGIHFPADLSGLAPGLGLVDGGRSGANGRNRNISRQRQHLAENEMDALLGVLMDLRTELSNLIHSSSTSSNGASQYESPQANQLRLQQQLLLTYLLHHCGYDGMTRQGQDEVWDIIRQKTGYDARMERDEEQQRKRWIAAMADNGDGNGNDGGGDVQIDNEDAARSAHSVGGGRKRPSSGSSRGRSPVANLDGMSAQQRLEHIKQSDENNNNNTNKGEGSRTVTFADGPTGTTTGTPGSATKRRRKATMMSIRNQMDVESGVAGARKQNAEEAERRRQRRIARRERRRERTERALESFVEKRREARRNERGKMSARGGGSGKGGGASGGAARAADASSDEEEFEFDDAEGAKKPAAATLTGASVPSEPESEPLPPKQTVSCPLCNANVEIDDGADADATLSAHINDCQRQRGGRGARRRRGGEGSTSTAGNRRAAAGKPVSYAETSSGDEDGEVMEECYHFEEIEDESSEEEKKSDSSSSCRKSTKRSSKKASNSDLDDESDDEESMLSPSSPPPDFEPSDLDHDAPTGDEDLDSLPFNTAPDDLEETNYDDRVDVWQELGVKRMKDMSERDDTHEDALPGPVMHDGGLVIPGWMNNRLFGYQRTGVRWMWELHRQEAGGIVGDEMVRSNVFKKVRPPLHYLTACANIYI